MDLGGLQIQPDGLFSDPSEMRLWRPSWILECYSFLYFLSNRLQTLHRPLVFWGFCESNGKIYFDPSRNEAMTAILDF